MVKRKVFNPEVILDFQRQHSCNFKKGKSESCKSTCIDF